MKLAGVKEGGRRGSECKMEAETRSTTAKFFCWTKWRNKQNNIKKKKTMDAADE